MKRIKPAVIGITGGVGAGKSSVMAILERNTKSVIMIADEIAKKMIEPDSSCYNDIVGLLGESVLNPDGSVNRERMAKLIYEKEELRQRVNALIHPAVNEYIKAVITREREAGECEFVFVEAALLIENGYDRICDELWYVYASEEVRKERLIKTRSYSSEKCDAIMKRQLSEETFKSKCTEVIDNNADEDTLEIQIKKLLERKREIFFGEG